MKQRRRLYLVGSIIFLFTVFGSIWLTLLQGFTINTITGLISLVVSIVLFRRWWLGQP